MIMDEWTFAAVFIILIILVCCIIASRIEYQEWNGGICRENGLPWERFDTDSQGGRGYRAGNVYCWQTWGHDL